MIRAAALLLLVASRAAAAPTPAGMGNPGGVRVYQDGAYIADCQAFDLAASDWAVALVGGGVCTLEAGPSVLVDNGGQIGAAADFSSIVDLSATSATILPAGTSDRPSACTAGSVYMETDDATVTNSGTSLCYTTGSPGTWRWIGDITSGGQAGGQSITGGTGAGDTLNLIPTSSSTLNLATHLGLCAGSKTYNTTGGTSECMQLWPDGLTWDAGSGDVLAGLNLSGTLTQVEDNFNTFSVINGVFTWDVTGTGVSFGAGVYLFNANITYQNSNANTVVGGAAKGLYFQYSAQKAGSGSNFSVSSVEAVTGAVGTIGTGTTVVDYVTGVRALTGGSVTGTLTNLWGHKIEAQTVGTNRMPYGAGEQTITGTPPAGYGAFGVETGAPNRFYFENESGHIWRMGYATVNGWGTALPTTATTVFFPVQGTLAANATETTAGVRRPAPGSIRAFAMSCGLTVAAGSGGDQHTFTLRAAGADVSGMSCSILNTAASCTARVEAGVAIAAPSLIDWKDVTLVSPAASEVMCVLYYTIDAF